MGVTTTTEEPGDSLTILGTTAVIVVVTIHGIIAGIPPGTIAVGIPHGIIVGTHPGITAVGIPHGIIVGTLRGIIVGIHPGITVVIIVVIIVAFMTLTMVDIMVMGNTIVPEEVPACTAPVAPPPLLPTDNMPEELHVGLPVGLIAMTDLSLLAVVTSLR